MVVSPPTGGHDSTDTHCLIIMRGNIEYNWVGMA